MKNYMELIEDLAGLDRCHCGPEMETAYNLLAEYYKGARLFKYQCGEKINHWILPPFWQCNQATLKAPDGTILASKDRNHLEVFTYSPSFSGSISLNELEEHLMSDPNRPDTIPFHFRNQYRHWSSEWGFSIPHNKRKELIDGKYDVNIESTFSFDNKLTQADYYHQGEIDTEFLFMSHFDHPSQVNDGLAGCIAAFEIIKRMKNRKTKYSYRAFASVEIVGSAAYLEKEINIRNSLQETLFLSFIGINSPLVYQQSFSQNSKLDQIIKHLLQFNSDAEDKMFKHRELFGNDENIFDSVGYNIPTGTLLRFPFHEYHTHFDSIDITFEENIEEVINMVFKIIDILENNKKVLANYEGVPCLSNPSLNLYLGPAFRDKNQLNDMGLNLNITEAEEQYLNDNPNLLYSFMNNVVRLADGAHTILEISDISQVPFGFTLAYLKKMEELDLIKLIEE